VPDMDAARAIKDIKNKIRIPIIADIHFDYRLALAALESGVDGLRLNPGNIGSPERVKKVVIAAKERGVPIRIGVNAGSLPSIKSGLDSRVKPENDNSPSIPDRMVAAALEHIKILEDLDFDLIKVSLKAFDVPTTIAAYKAIADKIPYPLHIGITEAGPRHTGVIRSSVGIGTLLYLGIGDTIRVSLTSHPREEVIAGWEILKSLDLRQHGPVLVSCPTCGRCEVDVVSLASRVETELTKIKKPIRVAVMGCAVNGPGEAKDADIGVACGKGKAILFKKGKQSGTIIEEDIVPVLMSEINKLD
ncbi:MAG TPA: flavodoxin-dependent (E)-4-hydroxy-3-methylbut-2-enyl-diphosphate synthase, partial [Dehalococcoidales bacterium]|nr:flavodoxin-dependent (E)-4-hydroxy-3-methylbut-2-enyl-diphosphate synthase [Dehalococcoidales bacterium]